MYRYEASSRAGFIELSDDSVGPEQLRALLLQVPRVCEVVPHRAGSKAAQGNASGGHAQQHNWQVQSVALQLRGANPLEFEVTTHNHVKPGALNGKQPTVTVCFKEPPHGAVREAWRILWGAVGHLALFPDKVLVWMRDAEEKEQRELCGGSTSSPAPPPAASLSRTVPGPPPREETWGKYGYLSADGCLRFWYSKDGDGAKFFLEPDAGRLGWRKHFDEAGVWWCHEEAGKWFREKNGQI